MPQQYFFISDWHIGGDDALQECDFEAELIDFLAQLAQPDRDTELIIVGDCFGLWEFTACEGTEKLDELIRHHQGLFEQFRLTGQRITITILPGNHDHELACYPQYSERLKQFNLNLEAAVSTTRDLGDKKIWIEHGMQDDANNRMPEFGNPRANPLGFFVAHHVVGNLGKHSALGKFNWLKDMQSVHPLEAIPHWMWSNYFYREMNSMLRLILVPFFALFLVSLIVVAGSLLEEYGLLNTTFFTSKQMLQPLGMVGNLLDIILLVNGTIIMFSLPIGIVLGILLWDMKKTLERYGLFATEKLVLEQHGVHKKAAERVLEQNPEVAVYLYGHTHHAYIEDLGGKAIVNTGTWLKKLQRLSSVLVPFPDVYYPSYCLNYVSIEREADRILINYEIIEKEAPQELSLLQRLLILPRRKTRKSRVPKQTVLEL